MRCYNGCPDKELQALLDESARIDKELAAVGARATYFPMEERWIIFRGNEMLTDFHSSKFAAATIAISKMKEAVNE